MSRLGYHRTEVTVAEGETTADVALEKDILGLEEVVVTGQATAAARRHLPNAVATVRDVDFGRSPSESLERVLSGRVAGANVPANTNAPGGGIQVELRGITSFLGGSPLYVVDGVIVSDVAVPSGTDQITRATTGSNPNEEQDNQLNRVADFNPADIESMEILKGASASAIYGSKASNGVIIITTKRGAPGPVRVDVGQRLGTFDLARTITRPFASAEEVDEAFGEGTAAEFDFDPRRSWERELAGLRGVRQAAALRPEVHAPGGRGEHRRAPGLPDRGDDGPRAPAGAPAGGRGGGGCHLRRRPGTARSDRVSPLDHGPSKHEEPPALDGLRARSVQRWFHAGERRRSRPHSDSGRDERCELGVPDDVRGEPEQGHGVASAAVHPGARAGRVRVRTEPRFLLHRGRRVGHAAHR